MESGQYEVALNFPIIRKAMYDYFIGKYRSAHFVFPPSGCNFLSLPSTYSRKATLAW
jgi:hypothetical protein